MSKTETIKLAIEMNEKLVTLEQRKTELLRKLSKSLRILAIWPEAFDNGPCSVGARLRPVIGERFRHGNYHERKGTLLPHEVNQGGFLYKPHAYLKDGAGNVRYITADQFVELTRGDD